MINSADGELKSQLLELLDGYSEIAFGLQGEQYLGELIKGSEIRKRVQPQVEHLCRRIL